MNSLNNDVRRVLDTLNNEIDADSIGALHAFFDEKPDSYSLTQQDLDYLKNRGIKGLDNLAKCSSYFIEFRESDKSNFRYFVENYSEVLPDIELIITPTNRAFSATRASSSGASAGTVASQLHKAGLAEKCGVKRTYRMTSSAEDYRMVEHVVNSIDEPSED